MQVIEAYMSSLGQWELWDRTNNFDILVRI